MGVKQAPSAVIVARNGARLYYVGYAGRTPAGGFIEDMVDASSGRWPSMKSTRSMIRQVENPVTVRVFVTQFCPYSPVVVRAAHRFAIENPLIRAEMVEASEFPGLRKHTV